MKPFFTFLVIIIVFATLLSCDSTPQMEGDQYALFYGVAEYDIITELMFTDDDAEAMGTLFEDRGYNVTVRTNSGATLENLQSDIEALAEKIDGDDTFLFYFSGHGGRHYDFYGSFAEPSETEPPSGDSDNEWILLSGSLQSEDYDSWAETAVNEEKLAKLISKLDTNKKIIIIDACNSGGFINNTTDIDGIPPNYLKSINENEERIFSKAVTIYFNNSLRDDYADLSYEDAIVIAASGEQEYSVELYSIEQGLFTYYFLRSSDRADINGDGYITATESYAYTAASLDVNWNSYISSDYHYHPRITGGPVDFVLFPVK